MTIRFSVVMPIHNEATLLRHSLPSVYALDPDEVILLFDRCSDDSVDVAEEVAMRFGCLGRTKFVPVDEPCDWRFRVAYLRRVGYELAGNDIVLATDADMILDVGLREHIGLVNDGFGLVSFEYLDYPVSFRNLLKRLLERVKLPFGWFTGIYVFRRSLWQQVEDAPMDVQRAEDTHLHVAMRRRFRTKCVLTRNIHLRPRESREIHYLRGRLYWSVARRSFFLTVLSALALFRPMLIKGYVHERFG